MKNVVFRTATTGNPSRMEKTGGKIRTIPDQALTIPQLMERYASGRSLPFAKDPQYDEQFEDFRALDKMERIDLMRDNAQFIQETQRILHDAHTTAAAGDKAAGVGDNSGDKAGDKPILEA